MVNIEIQPNLRNYSLIKDSVVAANLITVSLGSLTIEKYLTTRFLFPYQKSVQNPKIYTFISEIIDELDQFQSAYTKKTKFS